MTTKLYEPDTSVYYQPSVTDLWPEEDQNAIERDDRAPTYTQRLQGQERR